MDVPPVQSAPAQTLSALDQIAAGMWAVYLRDRSVEARNALLLIYRPLADRGARAECRANERSHRNAGLCPDDIQQMALIGLMKLIATYDPTASDCGFGKYASLLIRLRVKESIRAGSRISRHGWRKGCRQRVSSDALASGGSAFDAIEANGDSPTVPAELHEFRDRMIQRLGNDRDRAVFQLKFLAGLSSEQIGKYIGKSESVVSMALTRRIVPAIVRTFPDAPAGAVDRVMKTFRSNGRGS